MAPARAVAPGLGWAGAPPHPGVRLRRTLKPRVSFPRRQKSWAKNAFLFFMSRDYSKKNRAELLCKMAVESCRDLCSRPDSSRIMFLHFPHFWRATTTATAATTEEFLATSRPGIPSHPGIKYPVWAIPSLRYMYIYNI